MSESQDSLSKLLAELARTPEVTLAAMTGETAPLDPLVGAQLGEYVIRGRIGSGGMGIVYEGVQPVIGKRVAVKVLQGDMAGDPAQTRRFLDEARAVNAIRNRGIVDIFGFGQLPDGRQYFVMELLEGQPLDVVMRDRGPMSEADTLAVLDEVLLALSAAHAAGVIHRDLKPANVFLVSQPEGGTYVKLLDFGLAKTLPQDQKVTPQTEASALMGTPLYIAPEQAAGLPVGPATDLYALGVMAFEMLTGQPPFTADNIYEVVSKHLKAPPPRASSLRPVSRELDELLLRLLSKRPEERPASASQVRTMLRELPSHPPPNHPLIRVNPSRALEPAPLKLKTLERRRSLALARAPVAAVAGFVVVALGALWATRGSSGSPEGTWAATRGGDVMVVERQARDRYSVKLLDEGGVAVYERSGRVLTATGGAAPSTVEFGADYETAELNNAAGVSHFRKLDETAAREVTSQRDLHAARQEARRTLLELLAAEKAAFAKQGSYDEPLEVAGCADGRSWERPGVGWRAGCQYAYRAEIRGTCPDCELELHATGISELAKGDEWLAALNVSKEQWGPNDVSPRATVAITDATIEWGGELRIPLELATRPDYLNVPELAAMLQKQAGAVTGSPCAALHPVAGASSGTYGVVSRVLFSCLRSVSEIGLRAPDGSGRVIPTRLNTDRGDDASSANELAVQLSKAGLTVKSAGKEEPLLPRLSGGALDLAGLKKRAAERVAGGAAQPCGCGC